MTNLSHTHETDATINADAAVQRPVAIVTPGTYALDSGRSSSVELVTRNVSRELWQSHGLQMQLFGQMQARLSERTSPPVTEGIVYNSIPRKGYIRHVLNRLKTMNPALIQVENRPGYAQFLKRKLRGLPVILSLHSTTFLSRHHIARKRLLRCLREVDAIVVNSHYLRDVLLRIDRRLAGKLVVNHLGVDPTGFSPRWTEGYEAEREQNLEALGWKDCRVLLFVGRFIPIKGVHHLLKAMPAILRRHPEARLLLVGGAYYGKNATTPYVARLRRLAKPLKDRVRFVPYVAHDQIAEWFRLADIAVVPSSEREAFGLVNVEAMASGVPVIASGAGGMREVIEHTRTGLLVPLTRLGRELPERIGELLDDPAYARQLGEQGRERVLEHFTWAHTAERLAELYRRLNAVT